MVAAIHPGWFVVGFVVWVAVLVFALALARMAALNEGPDAELDDLSVPADACPPARGAPVSSHEYGRGLGRDGQPDRAGAQERWARDALRCQGARVDVAPVRCPLDEARG